MKFQDISDWLDNLEAENAFENQVIERIGSYLDNAEAQVPNDDLRKSLFFNHIYLDRDAYRLLMNHNPDWKTEVQSLVYGKPFNWQPDQVAQIMGVKNPVELFQKDNNGVPLWKKLAGDEKSSPEEMSKFLDEYYGFEDESPEAKGRLYKWLEAGQKQYDNQEKYGTGGLNALRRVFAPRVQEGLYKKGDYTWKDVLGDAGENFFQAIPWGRPAAGVGKVLTGTKALGRFYKPIHAGEYIASNAAAPLLSETYDVIAYDDFDNPSRSRFDIGDVLSGTAVNMTTAPAIGAYTSGAARAAGIDDISRKSVRDILSTDPYVTNLHRVTELKSKAPFETKRGVSKLMTEGDIYTKVFGPSRRKVNKWGKEQRAKWEDDLGIRNITTGDLDTDINLLNRYLASGNVPEEKVPIIKNLVEKMETFQADPKLADIKYDEFLRNREYMTPTAILEKQKLGGEYGLTEGANAELGATGFLSDNVNQVHGISPIVHPSRSASRLKKAEMNKAPVDKTYPVVESGFDRAVYGLENKPDVAAYSNRNKVLKPMFAGYATNKLGKQEYGKRITGKDVNLTEIDDSVADILSDDTNIRMWDAGFVPNGNPDEPIMRAYKIYLKNKNNGISPKVGKKAGL